MAASSAFKLLSHLPSPKNNAASAYDPSKDSWFLNRNEEQASGEAAGGSKTLKEPPPYGKRKGFIPRKVEDFGDGGAFPEIHVAQYPLDMGRREDKATNRVLPVNVDAQGRVRYDAIVKQGENASKSVYAQHGDLVPKLQDVAVDELKRPAEDEVEEATQRTKSALEKIVSARLSAAQPKNIPGNSEGPTLIKYTPSQQNSAFNSGAKERVIRMVEMPKDPLEPPKFKHKRVPKGSGSPPVPVMHSPPRPVTVKDQQDWKIPPCISNWKNAKGYTIPLDKRLAADGRGLQEVQINDNFARLSEALYVAETKAREAVETRSKIQRELILKEKEKKEQELRALAQKARMERASGVGAATGREEAHGAPPAGGGIPQSTYGKLDEEELRRGAETKQEREERIQRETIREERRKERERERRLESKEGGLGSSKRSKITRDRDRDISEKVALGMASTSAATGEVLYDQRLFNQDQGMSSGYAADDTYNVYDKGLFQREGAGGLYRPRKVTEEDEEEASERVMEKALKTDRFRADKGFAGAVESRGPRDKPVEFEQAVEADPFNLDQFLTLDQVKSGKRASDKAGSGASMHASGGSKSYDSYRDGGSEPSSRKRVDSHRGGGR